jgi:hypothetical protein
MGHHGPVPFGWAEAWFLVSGAFSVGVRLAGVAFVLSC